MAPTAPLPIKAAVMRVLRASPRPVRPPVILIGPMCAGKSTIAALLAERLGLPRFELDQRRWDYYREIGYDEREASRIARSDGMAGLLRYWKPFEAHAVERTMQDHTGAVIDLGAGHTVHDDPALAERVRAALAPHPNVVLLLPSADQEESISVLNPRLVELLRREVGRVDEAVLAANEVFVRHPANRSLAKRTVYTEGRSPSVTCEDVLAILTTPTG